jgi:hypothetical protein
MNCLYDYAAIDEEQHLMVELEAKHVRLQWRDSILRLRRSKAVGYLVELLLHPYQGISAVALHALVNHSLPRNNSPVDLGLETANAIPYFHNLMPMPLADPQTIKDIKLKLNLLTVRIAEADDWNDLSRLEEMKLERDSLLDYLQETLSGQKSQAIFRDMDYKCCDNVYHSLRQLLSLITRESPELGILLKESLQLWAELMFIPAQNLSVIVLDKG